MERKSISKFPTGFTIIELLVVISITSLLGSVVYTSLSNSRTKAVIASGDQFFSGVYHSVGAYPVAIYNFEEASGNTVLDSSGNGINGTLVNGPTRVAGAHGNGIHFDGINDYIQLSNNPLLAMSDNLTITMWLYLDAFGTYYAQNPAYKFGSVSPSQKNANYAMYLFGDYNGTRPQNKGLFYVYADCANCPGVAMRPPPPADCGCKWTNVSYGEYIQEKKWNFIAFTYDKNLGGKLFINGKTRGFYPGRAGGLGIDTASVARIYHGLGTIDDYRIYHDSLLAGDIERIYAEGLPKHLLANSTGRHD